MYAPKLPKWIAGLDISIWLSGLQISRADNSTGWMMLLLFLDPLEFLFTIFFFPSLGVLLISTSNMCCAFMENSLVVPGSHLPAGEVPGCGL